MALRCMQSLTSIVIGFLDSPFISGKFLLPPKLSFALSAIQNWKMLCSPKKSYKSFRPNEFEPPLRNTRGKSWAEDQHLYLLLSNAFEIFFRLCSIAENIAVGWSQTKLTPVPRGTFIYLIPNLITYLIVAIRREI